MSALRILPEKGTAGSRLTAAVLLVATLALFALAGWVWWSGLQREKAEIDALFVQRARAAAALDRLSAVAAHRDVEDAGAVLGARLLAAEGDSQAVAALVDAVRARLEGAGAQLVSVEALDALPADTLVRQRARVRFNGTVEAVQAFLHAVSGGTPLILTDTLSLGPRPGDAGLVDGEVEVSGFRAPADGGG